MSRVRRNWTPEEDALLRDLVKNELKNSRPLLWRELAKHIPGRSNKDCRKRWWNSLAGGTVKGPWSQEEDKKLIEAVWKHGTNWNQVAGVVGSRCADQCSSHWSQVLNPDINYCDWTTQEDEQLLHAVLSHGTNWSTIAASHTPQRTTLALKNRYSKLRLRHQTASDGKESSTAGAPSSPSTPAVSKSKTSNNTRAERFNANLSDDAEDEEGDEDREEEGDEDNEDEEGDKDMPSPRSLSTSKSHSPPEISRRAAPPGKVDLPKTPDMWAQYNGTIPTPESTAERWISGMMDQPMCVSTDSQLYNSDGFLNATPYGSRGDISMFSGHDEDAMNLDFGFQGSLLPDSEICNNQNPLSGDPAMLIASFPGVDMAALTPESLKDTSVSVKDGSIGTKTPGPGSGLHHVSIDLSCTTEQLSNIMTGLARSGSAINIKIDTR